MKKKKLTCIASVEGVKMAEKALVRLGFDSKINFAQSQLLSRSTVTKFFNKQPIQLGSFLKICEALKLNWEEIVGLQNINVASQTIDNQPTFSHNIEMVASSIETISRKLVINRENQEIYAEITLQGDINSVQSDLLFWYNFLTNILIVIRKL